MSDKIRVLSREEIQGILSQTRARMLTLENVVKGYSEQVKALKRQNEALTARVRVLEENQNDGF